ncbi:MAG: argininosuccinate lyase [Puniceicoccales bacterium]|nr:argininosuccinate lyase [Puniceicoccales bacterium]
MEETNNAAPQPPAQTTSLPPLPPVPAREPETENAPEPAPEAPPPVPPEAPPAVQSEVSQTPPPVPPPVPSQEPETPAPAEISVPPTPKKSASAKTASAKTAGTGAQPTWGGRFSTSPAALMLRIGESVSFDARLAPFDIRGSRAHAAMLHRCGLLTGAERLAIDSALSAVLRKITAGRFKWDTALEDVHMNIERALAERTPAAEKLHAGRSRNDQVATDMRLFFKHAAGELSAALRALLGAIVALAERSQEILVPGYTHLQRAQPVSAAHHLLAYAEMFGRDLDRFGEFKLHANFCPLGSGAIAGTTLPIDRDFAARRLGFRNSEERARLTQNSMDAVADRDLFIEFATNCALCGSHFSRVAEDLIIWSSPEFGLVTLPEGFTTGSSLMPQKRNPDALELMRGKSARLNGNVSALLSLVKGLPLTYNRDLQEDKPPVFDSFDTTLLCLNVLAEVIRGLAFRTDRCAAAVSDPLLLATDLADYLVKRGVPFRAAHHAVGAAVALAEKTATPLNALTLEQVRAIHPAFGEDWTRVFDLGVAMRSRERTGMPGPMQVALQIALWNKRLEQAERQAGSHKRRLADTGTPE